MIVKFVDNTKQILQEMFRPDYETIKAHFFGTKKDSTSAVEKQVPSNKMNDKKHLI